MLIDFNSGTKKFTLSIYITILNKSMERNLCNKQTW